MTLPNMSGHDGDGDDFDERPGRDPGDLLNDDGSIDVSTVTSISNANHHDGPPITLDRCQRFRERAAHDDAMPADIADGEEFTPKTVRWHLRGECKHDSGSIPALVRGWYETTPETPRTCEPANNAVVDAETCGEIRRRLLDGGSCKSVATEIPSVSHATVERHGTGRCSHSHGDPHPLTFAWRVPEEGEP